MFPAIERDLPSPSVAKIEAAQRELARRSFLRFCVYVDKRYETPPHIRLLAEKLQQVYQYIQSGGKEGIGRLMIAIPPQHGKSALASRYFPAWLLGMMPDSRIILTSYGESLAVHHSKFVRDLLDTPEFQAVFGRTSTSAMPVELSSDSRSNEAWDVARPHRGGLKAAGVGGGITGLPAHLFIIDDPFKNREEAESETRRELVDDWFKSAARTRLRPNAAVVIFHTRWHPDDLAGRLIRRMVTDPLASQWEVVCMPALALDQYPTEEEQTRKMRDGIYVPLRDPLSRENGAALCPQWYDEKYLISTRADMGAYDFEALYQQSPFMKSGSVFQREWFTVVDEAPKDVVARIRAWDKAGTKNAGARTAGVLLSWGKDDYIYVEHAAAERFAPAERDMWMLKIAQQDAENYGNVQIWHPQDPNSAGKESAMAFNNMLADRGFNGRFSPVSEGKEEYADTFATKAMGGRVRMVRGAWNDDFLDELAAFPKGRYKDRVDAASWGYNRLAFIVKRGKKEVRSYQG